MNRARIITTIVTPAEAASSSAGAYDLATLVQVKEELKITDSASNTLLQRYLSGASLAISKYCNRVFVAETVKDEFWPQRDPYPNLISGGIEPLQLTRFPIISVASVIEDSIALTVTTDYLVDADKGQLVRMNAASYPRTWPAFALSAQYVAGFAEIPDDIVDAVIRMVKQRWFSRGRDPMVRQENIPGVRDVQYWIATGAEAGNMPPDVIDILDNYRVPVTA